MSSSAGISKLTGRGEGAIAVYRFCGTAALQLATERLQLRSGLPLSDLPQNKIYFGLWRHQTGDSTGEETTLQEDVVVCRTSDDACEIHTHGSPAVEDSLHALCQERGLNWNTQATAAVDFLTAAELADWGKRLTCLSSVGLPGHSARQLASWLASQLQVSLLKCQSTQSGELLLQNARFRFLEAIERVAKTSDAAEQIQLIDRLLDSWSYGKHLVEPVVVLLTGPPNVGKSSLINAILGYQRSIVSNAAGTTRDLVIQETVIHGWPFLLVDSAGIRDSHQALEVLGIQRATEARQVADLIVEVHAADDPSSRCGSESSDRILRVLNKVDLKPEECTGFDVATSAISGTGISQLLEQLAEATARIIRLPGDWKNQPVVTTEPILKWLQQLKEGMQNGDLSA